MVIAPPGENETFYRAHTEDSGLTACDGQAGSWTGDGTLSTGATRLTVEVVVTCPDGTERGPLPMDINYNADNDTLSDNTGVTWTRQ